MYRMETERILILTIIHGARDISQKKPRPWDIA
jgi:plasmid stabilization system protein ParE